MNLRDLIFGQSQESLNASINDANRDDNTSGTADFRRPSKQHFSRVPNFKISHHLEDEYAYSPGVRYYKTDTPWRTSVSIFHQNVRFEEWTLVNRYLIDDYRYFVRELLQDSIFSKDNDAAIQVQTFLFYAMILKKSK